MEHKGGTTKKKRNKWLYLQMGKEFAINIWKQKIVTDA